MPFDGSSWPPLDLDVLYRAHVEAVRRALRRRGVTRDDVDDLAQRVFVVALRRRDGCRVDCPRAWLLGIAARVASEHRRAAWQQRRGELPLDPADPGGPRALARVALGEAAATLAALSEPVRRAAVMHLVEGYTAEEVGARCGVSANTASSRVRLARHRLAARFVTGE